MSDWKTWTSIPSAVLATVGVFGLISQISPPWPSREEFKELKTRVVASELQAHRQRCFDVANALGRAQQRLKADPSNAVEELIVEQRKGELFSLQCDSDQ